MFITKDFVMLNLPKSASTFSRTVLKKVYKDKPLNKYGYFSRWIDRFLPSKGYLDFELYESSRHKNSQHGGYSKIPLEFRNRKIVSSVRSPYSRYVSQYHYRSWARKPYEKDNNLLDRWPGFPNLSFSQFYRLRKEWVGMKFGISANDVHVGQYTMRFIKMYAVDPGKSEQLLMDGASFEEISEGMADIHFLRQENLREDLVSLLKDFDISQEELKIISDHQEVNTSKVKKGNKHKLTEEERALIRKDDWFVFQYLESKGIRYE